MAAEVRQVTESVVCVRRASYLTCSYIVKTPAGVVLVDAGMDSDAADVEVGLAALGVAMETVRGVLLTHWHNDHAAGAAAVHARSRAPVLYHRGDEPHFTGRGGATGGRRWLSDRIPEVGVLVLLKGLLGEATPRAVRSQQFVEEGDRVFEHFEVVTTPGHTKGHVSYFYRPERVLFAGDALAVINGRVRFMARPVTLDTTAARHSLEKCLSLRPAIICPGHREPLTTGVEEACDAMRRHLEAGRPWPLFG